MPSGRAADGTEIWLMCTPASLVTLTLMVLRPSSSTVFASDNAVGGLRDPMLFVFAVADPFICWISYVIFSVFMASRMLVVAVGSSASTVKVQSSWFCSNRRRKLYNGASATNPASSKGQGPYFSLAMRSLLMRSRASLSLLTTYWVTT